MKVKIALEEYIKLNELFAPEYEMENEVLAQFKKLSPTLSEAQTHDLIEILKNDGEWEERFFVADLLYLYETFDFRVLEPLLENAIELKDPSLNRIFLFPAVRTFGF